jgi:hypothetical protein
MARKKMLTGTITLTLKVTQTDGVVPETLESLKTWAEEELDGAEVYLADPDEEEETVVTLELVTAEVTTG